jgi:hypothetical protein
MRSLRCRFFLKKLRKKSAEKCVEKTQVEKQVTSKKEKGKKGRERCT